MSKQPVNLANVVISRPSEPAPALPRVDTLDSLPPMDTRIPVTTRLDASVHERLRLLAFKTRRKKQDLIQQALESYLTQHGV